MVNRIFIGALVGLWLLPACQGDMAVDDPGGGGWRTAKLKGDTATVTVTETGTHTESQTGTFTVTATGTETGTRTATGCNTKTVTSTQTKTATVTVPGPATSPNPGVGDTGVNITSPKLAWSKGADAAYSMVLYWECTDTSAPPKDARESAHLAATYYTDLALQGDTKYCWRVDGENAAGVTTGVTWYFTTEPARLPGKAQVRSPSIGKPDVAPPYLLLWTPQNPAASSYDVYLGKTKDLNGSGDFQGNQTAARYQPARLDGFTTYYWRIDPKNAAGTTTGDTWSFTTGTTTFPA